MTKDKLAYTEQNTKIVFKVIIVSIYTANESKIIYNPPYTSDKPNKPDVYKTA